MTTINFDKLRKEYPSFRCNGWCKTVTSLDKSTPTGYSLVGEFVRKGKGDFEYLDGVYLDCSKPQGQKNYHIFKVEDGNVEVLQVLEDAPRKWATELWDTIDKALADSPQFGEEYKAQQLANIVLEQTSDKSLLNEVARLISAQYEGEPFFKNPTMVRGFLGYHKCVEFPFAQRHSNGEFWEYEGEWSKRNTIALEKELEDGYSEHQAFFRVVIADRFDISVEDIKNGDVQLEVKILNEFEFQEKNQFHYGVPYYYFFGEHFGDAPYGIKQFDIRNFMIVGYSKGDKWNKPRLYVKLFSDKCWNNYLGEYKTSP